MLSNRLARNIWWTSSFRTTPHWHRISGRAIPTLIHRYSSIGKYMPRPLFNPKQPIDWFLDWDGTITKKDTLDTLVNIAARKKPDVDISALWKQLGQAYYDDYSVLQSEQMKDPPTTLEGEKRFLNIIEAAEIRSVDRVSNSGIFSGLTPADISRGAAQALENNEVQIRPGFAEFCKRLAATYESIEGQEANLEIISVNWSARFIEECLRAAKLGPEIQRLQLKIHANELENIYPELGLSQKLENEKPHPHSKNLYDLDEESSTGRIVPAPGTRSRIIFSRDKLSQFFRARNTDPQTKLTHKVYIGDSWTDLECLLAADLGICIRDEPMTSTQQKLADSLQRLGIECRRLRDMFNESDSKMDKYSVVWVQDFREINEWLDGARKCAA